YYNTKEQNFWKLPEIPNLKSLKVTFTNVKNLDGLKKYPKLKELELYYCRNLNTFDGIEKMSKDIYFIQIDNAKKLTGYEHLKVLANIETLRLNDDGPMENLNFIFDLPNLTSFSFVHTNVIDGNLTPLLEHEPMFEVVGFFDKRHYSHKSKYIEEYLGCCK
ncbi:MAG: leucine-rich repeat domain-containing protein, partial [Firmicutes bacterium]|nr:leucine-rich repeat domain-containing protein [Bacillota bacterium]